MRIAYNTSHPLRHSAPFICTPLCAKGNPMDPAWDRKLQGDEHWNPRLARRSVGILHVRLEGGPLLGQVVPDAAAPGRARDQSAQRGYLNKFVRRLLFTLVLPSAPDSRRNGVGVGRGGGTRVGRERLARLTLRSDPGGAPPLARSSRGTTFRIPFVPGSCCPSTSPPCPVCSPSLSGCASIGAPSGNHARSRRGGTRM